MTECRRPQASVMLVLLCVAAQDLELSRSTIDGGGMMNSAGGRYELSGTNGQPDAGVMMSGAFELTGGFWFQTPPGDCNDTGDVNLFDYADFEPCLSGPELSVAEGCECYDVNRGGTVDLLDFACIVTGNNNCDALRGTRAGAGAVFTDDDTHQNLIDKETAFLRPGDASQDLSSIQQDD